MTNDRAPHVRIVRLVVLATLASTAFVGDLATPARSTPVIEEDRPNILVFLTDDQRPTDTMQYMPKTSEWFGEGGTTFSNGFATTPICCPARAALMSGRFNHNNGVRKQSDAQSLDADHTIQAYLGDAGYRTAVVGKYLNGFPAASDPPRWDRWHVLIPSGETYYDNEFNNQGVVQEEPGYSTNVIRDKSIQLLSEFDVMDDQPWFLYVAPFAPHHPWEAGPGDENADVGTWNGNPAVREKNRKDKPRYVRKKHRTLAQIQSIRQGQLRSLLAVDDLVDDVMEELEARGETNTLAFFLSDNGFMWAEHGLSGKTYPYTESIKVPFLARWPGQIAEGRTDHRLVANIDLAPTMAEAAGIEPDPAVPFDGHSLLGGASRKKMLTEAWTGQGGWASVRARDYQYIEYYGRGGGVREREYYNMATDRWQLRNLFGDGRKSNDPYPGALQKELAAARGCVGSGPSSCMSILTQPALPLRCPGARRFKGHHQVGSTGPDRIPGTKKRDVACGRDGDDRIVGKKGDDILLGQGGNDVLVGGPGDDVLIGGPGHDVCIGGKGKNRYRGCEKKR